MLMMMQPIEVLQKGEDLMDRVEEEEGIEDRARSTEDAYSKPLSVTVEM